MNDKPTDNFNLRREEIALYMEFVATCGKIKIDPLQTLRDYMEYIKGRAKGTDRPSAATAPDGGAT